MSCFAHSQQLTCHYHNPKCVTSAHGSVWRMVCLHGKIHLAFVLFEKNREQHCEWMFFPLSSSSDMFDKTRSGRIDVFGFSALWDFMQRWRALFQQYDRDHSGSISAMELQQGISRARHSFCADQRPACWQFRLHFLLLCLLSSALAQMGYNLSPQFSQTLVQRFSVRGGCPGMQLDRFIQVCTQLQSTTQFFRERDTAMTGNIRISYEDFLSGAITRLMWASLHGQSVSFHVAVLHRVQFVRVSRKVIILHCGLIVIPK